MGSKLRVISVSTYYPGPDCPAHGVFVQRRLAALARLTDLHVVHLRPWFPFLRAVSQQQLRAIDGESPRALRRRMFYLPGFKRFNARWLRRALVPIVRELRGDRNQNTLLDAHFGYPEGVGATLAGAELDLPVFMTLRGVEPWILSDRSCGPQLDWAMERCAGLICVAQSLADLVIQRGVLAAKVCVIPNAVSRDIFHPGDCPAARQTLDIGDRERLIVSVGMLESRKGHHRLIEAFANLRHRWPALRLAIVGGATHEPRYPAKLKRMLKQLGLQASVRLTGALPPKQVAKWLQASDLFVLPTSFEGNCNAILEALACGVPVVTTPVGDNARIVDPPQRGLIVPTDDLGALVQAIDAALGRDWDRTSIARFETDYTWDEVARRTTEFFQERLRN